MINLIAFESLISIDIIYYIDYVEIIKFCYLFLFLKFNLRGTFSFEMFVNKNSRNYLFLITKKYLDKKNRF